MQKFIIKHKFYRVLRNGGLGEYYIKIHTSYFNNLKSNNVCTKIDY